MSLPLAIVDFGSFYAGGRPVRIDGRPTRRIAFTATAGLDYDPNGTYHFEQAYVQYFIPARRMHALPLVLLHGGGMSGAMWEHTPDRRRGWVQEFVARGHAVYVVDNVERGRAGWAPFDEVWPEQPIMRSAEEAWTLFRFGDAAGFPARRGFDGQRFPVAHLDTFIQQAVPRWLGNNDIALRSFCAVLERVGPCVVMAHSHGGEVAYRALQAQPGLVRSVIGIEPSGFCDTLTRPHLEGKPLLFVYGDFLDATPLWRGLHRRGEAFARELAAHGAQVDTWHLPALGIHGNSHMPMMDDNSEAIAERISAWIGAHPA